MLFLLVILLSQPGNARQTVNMDKRPKIALVLSGGGAKGFAHIGVLKVLEEEGIPIDLIVGTSMGSLVGGVYSLGYRASELETLVKTMNWETTLSDDVPRTFLSKNDQMLKQRYVFSLPVNGNKKLDLPQGLIRGQNVLDTFCGLAGNVPKDIDFSEFPISFACVATDLETGKEVVIKSGFLPTAMYSSMAIPLVFQPSDRNGKLLVDGGLVNNFPTDVAKRMGADIIIGIDIRNDLYDREKLKTLDNIVGQLIGFFDQSKDSLNRSLCDLIIRPDISGYSISSFSKSAADTLIMRGEREASTFREQLRALKAKYKLAPPVKSREFTTPEQWYVTDMTFAGSYHVDNSFLKKTLQLAIPGYYTADEIKTAIDKLYGLGGFDLIYYDLTDTPNGKSLNLTITTKKVFTQSVGFKVNTTDAAAILVNTTRKNYRNVLGLLSASAELSVNPGLELVAETNKTNSPALGINLKGKYQNFDVFEKTDKVLKANVFYMSGALYLYKPFMNKFSLGLGLQEEYYKGDMFWKHSNPEIDREMDYFLTNAYAYLSLDNMDDYYFPSKGTNMYGEFSFVADFKQSNELCPVALFKMKNVIPLAKSTSILFDINGRAVFNNEFPKARTTLVGGEPYSQYFNCHLPFVGLPAVNLAKRYTYIGLIGLRINILKSQYLSLLLNGMWQDTDLIFREGIESTYGGGIRYSIKTMQGPLELTLGYAGTAERPSFSANFGLYF